MVPVALQVYDSRTPLQEPRLMSVGERLPDLDHVLVPLTNVDIVPDPDKLGQKRNHHCGLPDCLAVSYLALLFVEVLDRKAEKVGSRRKAKTGPGRVIPEEPESKTRGDIPPERNRRKASETASTARSSSVLWFQVRRKSESRIEAKERDSSSRKGAE